MVRNEQIKLAAGAVNTLATAMITVGVLAPTAAILYGLSPPDPSRPVGVLLLSGAVWVCMGAALHFAAQMLVGMLRE